MRRVLIRPETERDRSATDEVHRRAFAPPAPGAEPIEVGLVHALRADPGWIPALALVAEDSAGNVVGHLVGTEGRVGTEPVVGLGPFAVLPDRQRAGVGQALMHTVLGAADALGYPAVVLLGHLDYYPRFGFGPADQLGIEAPDPSWGEYFQARAMSTYDPALRGRFTYAAPFADL